MLVVLLGGNRAMKMTSLVFSTSNQSGGVMGFGVWSFSPSRSELSMTETLVVPKRIQAGWEKKEEREA